MHAELERLFASASRVESYLRLGMVPREVAYAQLLAIQTVDDAGRVWVVLPHEGALRLHILTRNATPALADPSVFTVSVKPAFAVWKKLRRLDSFPRSAAVRAGALLVGFGVALVWMLPSGHSRGMALVHQDPPTVLAERCEDTCGASLVVTLQDSRIPGEASPARFCSSALPTTTPASATDLGDTVECRFTGCTAKPDGGRHRCLAALSKP